MKLSKMSRRKQVLLSSVLTLTMAVAGFLAFPQQASACIVCVGQYTVCGPCQEAWGGFWKQWCRTYEYTGGCYPNCTSTLVSTYPRLCSP